MKTERHERKVKGDKPMTDQTSLKKPVAKARFACKYATRERRGGKRPRQVPMNLQLSLAALVTLCHAKMAGHLETAVDT